MNPPPVPEKRARWITSGFHWADGDIIEQIIKSIEDPGTPVLIYYALCRISSDEFNRATFKASFKAIAGKCGMSSKTVERRIPELAQGGFITIRPGPPNTRIPNTYTLLQWRVEPPLQT